MILRASSHFDQSYCTVLVCTVLCDILTTVLPAAAGTRYHTILLPLYDGTGTWFHLVNTRRHSTDVTKHEKGGEKNLNHQYLF
jgi:hypothetical protein